MTKINSDREEALTGCEEFVSSPIIKGRQLSLLKITCWRIARPNVCNIWSSIFLLLLHCLLVVVARDNNIDSQKTRLYCMQPTMMDPKSRGGDDEEEEGGDDASKRKPTAAVHDDDGSTESEDKKPSSISSSKKRKRTDTSEPELPTAPVPAAASAAAAGTDGHQEDEDSAPALSLQERWEEMFQVCTLHYYCIVLLSLPSHSHMGFVCEL